MPPAVRSPLLGHTDTGSLTCFNLVCAVFRVTMPPAVRPPLLGQMNIVSLTCKDCWVRVVHRKAGVQVQRYKQVYKRVDSEGQNKLSLTLPRQGIEPRVFGFEVGRSAIELRPRVRTCTISLQWLANVSDYHHHACNLSQLTDSFTARFVTCFASFLLAKARETLVIWKTKILNRKFKIVIQKRTFTQNVFPSLCVASTYCVVILFSGTIITGAA